VAEHEWSVVLAPVARRQLVALPADVQRRVGRVIDGLAAQPRPRGAKLLAGPPHERIWRIRVGDHRVLYDIQDMELVVLVVGIGHRREVYRRR
jgi:mRNA interferase RelE/StbE